MTRRVCAVTLLAVGLAAPVCAQDVEGYVALARAYAAGNGDTAIEALRGPGWSERTIAQAADVAAHTASVHDLLSAAVLHTDLANTLMDTQPMSARFHLSQAVLALDAASSRIGQRQPLAPFVRRWYRFVASVYTSCQLFGPALDHIQQGLDRFPTDADLFVARGIVAEISTRKYLLSDWRRDTVFGATNRRVLEDALERAATHFRRGLSLDARNAEAHLHLGWIRAFLGDAGAKADLDAALAAAPDDRTRYLSHLFLGGLAEWQRHLEDARREYEEAKTLGPEYQTPYAALSRTEQALGHESRARELALIAVQLEKPDADDPWWDFRIGYDREGLAWLRREVRQPQ